MMRLLMALGLALALPAPAQAHKPSDSYLSIAVGEAGIEGQWDIALRDLDFALGLDADGNGEISWGEVRAKHGEIAAYALARLAVRGDGAACRIEPGAQQIDTHTDGAYTVLPLAIRCAARTPAQLAIDYSLFADLDPQHRGLLKLQALGNARTAVLGPQAPTQSFELKTVSRWAQFVDYAREGVWHIWIGFDHILFLLALLLPAVLLWRGPQGHRWQAAETFRAAFIDVFRIVTAFTLAHSITLSLAALGAIELPSRWVESAIAASVVLAALNNVWPVFRGRRWMVAFAFGLIHGFGFASVLADLGLPREALVLALVGFNLGVEGGQLAMVAVFLPLAFALRRSAFYRQAVMVGGSLLIAALAGIWLVERAFALKLLGL
ncbi:MAG: HupE/UreJ family protein [Burkholderiaceae bacterium]|nr:HupE/UreJ family protein [Burkholderiaceae bacterium]